MPCIPSPSGTGSCPPNSQPPSLPSCTPRHHRFITVPYPLPAFAAVQPSAFHCTFPTVPRTGLPALTYHYVRPRSALSPELSLKGPRDPINACFSIFFISLLSMRWGQTFLPDIPGHL